MTEFFVTARSFAAPIFSDSSEKYVEVETATEALESFRASYSHPFGLFAAEVWPSADDYHKQTEPLAVYRSERAAKQAAGDPEWQRTQTL